MATAGSSQVGDLLIDFADVFEGTLASELSFVAPADSNQSEWGFVKIYQPFAEVFSGTLATVLPYSCDSSRFEPVWGFATKSPEKSFSLG